MRVHLVLGVVWLLIGLGRLIGMLTATRDLIGWDWALTGGFFALSLLYFVSAYVKAKRHRRVVP